MLKNTRLRKVTCMQNLQNDHNQVIQASAIFCESGIKHAQYLILLIPFTFL